MRVPALVRRAGWNLGEQMISSLTNSVLSILVANSVSADSFGGFAIAFTVFALSVGGIRAVSTSPLNIRFSDASPAEAKRVAAASAGNALVLGILIGTGCAVAGLVLPGALGESLLALGVVMPALLVQDTYRYVFFARGEPVKAAMTSGLWAVLQIGAVTALLVVGTEAVGTLLLAWGISAAAAALLAVRQSGAWPAPQSAWSWIKEHRDLTGYKLATFATAQGSSQGAILVIAAVATLSTVGSLRGTQVLLGPTSILALATLNFALPELSRRRSRMTDRTWFYAALGVSGFVGLAGLVWGSIFLLAPESLGEFVLAESWPGTSAILFAAVVTQVLSGLSIGPVTVIYAIDRAPATLSIQIILGVLTFVGGVGGVLLGGAIGAQWGFAAASAIVVPCWYIQMRRQLKWVAENRHAVVEDSPQDTVITAAASPRYDAFLDDVSNMSTMLLPLVPARDQGPVRPSGPGGPVPSAPTGPLVGTPGRLPGATTAPRRPPLLGRPPRPGAPVAARRSGRPPGPPPPAPPPPGRRQPAPDPMRTGAYTPGLPYGPGGPNHRPDPVPPPPGQARPGPLPPHLRRRPGPPPPGRPPQGPPAQGPPAQGAPPHTRECGPAPVGGPPVHPPWAFPTPADGRPEPHREANAGGSGNGRAAYRPSPVPRTDVDCHPSPDSGPAAGQLRPVPYRRVGGAPRPRHTSRRPAAAEEGAEATPALAPTNGAASGNGSGSSGAERAGDGVRNDDRSTEATQVHAVREPQPSPDDNSS